MLYVADDGSTAPSPLAGDDVPGSQEDHFSTLYRRHYGDIVKLCRRYIGSERDAEAVAQEAFVRVWRSRERFEAGRAFWPYVATIARRLCINELKSKVTRSAALAHVGADPTTVDDPFAANVAREEVATVLDHLTERQRRLLYLRDMEGWSYEDIARLDGITVEGVRSTLKRARATFRKLHGKCAQGLLGGFLGLGRWWRRTGTHCPALVGARVPSDALAAAVAVLLLGSAQGAVGVPPSVSPPAAASEFAAVAVAPVDEQPPSLRAVGAARASASAPSPAQPPAPPIRAGIDEQVYEFTPSPSYHEDRTVFATTSMSSGCEPLQTSCTALYKSADGGESWSRLPARGASTGTLLLPPSYPGDSRIFLQGGSFLFVSEDDGETFRPVAPIPPGTTTVSPLFSGGDPRFIIGRQFSSGGGTPLELRDGDPLPRPLSLPLDPGVVASTVLFSPSYASDRRLLVVGFEPAVSLRPYISFDLFSCAPDACTRVVEDVHPHLVRTADGGRTVYVGSVASPLLRSLDGQTFEPVALPDKAAGNHILQVSADGNGTVLVSAFGFQFPDGRLYRSTDAGRNWTVVPWRGSVITTVLALPDGRVLASHAEGVRCSDDGGASWAPTCAPAA